MENRHDFPHGERVTDTPGVTSPGLGTRSTTFRSPLSAAAGDHRLQGCCRAHSAASPEGIARRDVQLRVARRSPKREVRPRRLRRRHDEGALNRYPADGGRPLRSRKTTKTWGLAFTCLRHLLAGTLVMRYSVKILLDGILGLTIRLRDLETWDI